MQVSLWIILSGLCGSLLMLTILWSMYATRLSHADMIRALGSLFTRKFENAWWPGFCIHILIGTLFAFGYAFFITYVLISKSGSIFLTCVFLGLLHGLIVSIILHFVISIHHPLKRFQRTTTDVVITHVLGHIFYGFGVGSVLATIPFSKIAAFFS